MKKEGEAKLTRKGIITKELKIKQNPIVELKATGVETNGLNTTITPVYMLLHTSAWSQERKKLRHRVYKKCNLGKRNSCNRDWQN